MLASQCIEARRAAQWVAKGGLPKAIRRKVKHADVVMDVGSGIEPQTLVWPKIHICVDVHDEYVKYLRNRLSGSPRYLVLHARWEEALRIMSPKSVDTVFAIDFIEHLSKEDGWRFLAQAQRVARRQVVVFTPLGYFPQSFGGPDEKDRWGMHGGYWQTHRSGWTPEDFPAEWDIIGCRDYHTEDQHGRLDEPAGCFWAVRTFQEGSAADPMEWRLWRKTTIHRHAPAWCLPALRGMKRLLLQAGRRKAD